jgi:hypothetical protein
MRVEVADNDVRTSAQRAQVAQAAVGGDYETRCLCDPPHASAEQQFATTDDNGVHGC